MTTNKTRGNLRPLLWLVLAVSLAGNVATQSMGTTILASIGCGVVAVASGAWLALDHYRNRR
jgi:hypothetical protein